MRYPPAKDLVGWLAGAGALLGGVALGFGARWLLQKRRRQAEAGHALVPLATSRALVPYEEPGLPAVAPSRVQRTGSANRSSSWIGAILVLTAAAVSTGAVTYRDSQVERRVDKIVGGVAGRAIPLMRANGCGGCHTIAGVPGAQGLVGPQLDATLSTRVYIAGVLPNDRQTMIHWLRSAREMVPHTAMPSSGMSEQDARDIAAYLYGLR